MRVGVIGGTGFYRFGPGEPIEVETRWGAVELQHRRLRRHETFFLPRHGPHHEVPPHRVNARAQVAALAAAKIDYAVGVFNVGAVDPDLPTGAWMVPHDLLDFTKGRTSTFFDESAVHVEMDEPFCPSVRSALLKAGPGTVRDGGVYAATEGPRFETRAERRALRALGAHVAGMTAVPEAVLARELGLCHAALCFVANGTQEGPVAAQTVQKRLRSRSAKLRAWLEATIDALPAKKTCLCAERSRRGRLTEVLA